MEAYKKGELAKKILLFTIAGGAIATVVVLPGLAILFQYFKADNTFERSRIKNAIRRMEQNKLVVRRIVNGQEEYILTGYGQGKATSYLLEDMKLPTKKKWDGVWRVLMFDIPESKQKVRREISFKIKEIGMKAVQNSVFIFPYPCKKEMDAVIDHYNVRKHFIYLEAATYEGVDDLKKHFHLI